MIAQVVGVLLACQAVLGYPGPYPRPMAGPGPMPMPGPGPRPDPQFLGGIGYDGLGLGYGGLGLGYGGIGLVEEVITPPVSPPVLNTVDVYDIATLGIIPAPPVEYIYPAVGYEAFGLGGGVEVLGGGIGLGLGGYGGYPYGII